MDLFGKALTDYLEGDHRATLTSHSSFGEAEPVPVSHFFRGFRDMPELERLALEAAKGKVLDIGCGAGSHCLWLQEQGMKCTGIDASQGAVAVARTRGVKMVHYTEILNFKVGKYDTLLLLMNGTGLAGTLSGLPGLLKHLRLLMAPGGQILVDSSDLIYMYEEDADGGVWIPGDLEYYGNVEYRWEYRGEAGKPFPWLFADAASLAKAAAAAGLQTEVLAEGPHYDYLARLTALYTETTQ
ncbi:methyltransferase domain-containing protein [Robiginitalea sp. M366]|uniref:class I SAM-dependent methyltransferase n=1 Tax=Robiginitalea aestuariiviva TaxID=3036903 RepID=UPI00240D9499|nr:methyltransferase domain-containing protein [Robiginitalea aestuariiviva]MDG1572163.1 methyltransferase domain-containing protein [Robiginitalea aestuariiviva]